MATTNHEINDGNGYHQLDQEFPELMAIVNNKLMDRAKNNHEKINFDVKQDELNRLIFDAVHLYFHNQVNYYHQKGLDPDDAMDNAEKETISAIITTLLDFWNDDLSKTHLHLQLKSPKGTCKFDFH